MLQDDLPSDPPAVLFRPSKKRKVFRQRLDTAASATAPAAVGGDDASASPNPHNIATIPCPPGSADEQDDDDNAGSDDQHPESVSVSELIRARNARKARLRGIAFTADQGLARPADAVDEASPPSERSGRGDATVSCTSASDTTMAVPNRFTTATGVIGELNTRHMMEYIESRLAKRLQPQQQQQELQQQLQQLQQQQQQPQPQLPQLLQLPQLPQQLSPSAPTTAPAHAAAAGLPLLKGLTAPPHKVSDSQPPALRGRILEVDLGAEVRSRNVTLTQRAARRLKEDKQDDSDEVAAASGRKAASRPAANRRTSDDIRRDKIVEEFLHQNRLDVYDMDPAGGELQHSGGNYFDHDLDAFDKDDQDVNNIAADDRIAEQFRREFMDALHERQQLRRRKRRAATNAPPRPRPGPIPGPTRPGKRDDGDVLRGPKLGGSRNDRAQMRDILLANQKERKAPVPAQRRR